MQFKLILPLLLLLSTHAVSCKFLEKFSKGSTKSLEPTKKKGEVTIPSFKLGFAEKNGIKNYQIVREFLGTSNQVSESLGSVIRVRFGKLTNSQYNLLMDHYGGQNFVPYDANRSYELQDFLPPKIQALAYRWLIPTSQTDTRIPTSWGDPYRPGEPVKSFVEMNCWSAAYEVVREWSKPWASTLGTISYFGPRIAEQILWSNEAAIESKTSLDRRAWSAESVTQRNTGRKPGDLLYIKTKFSPMGPAHVAVWIDDDLYFEKTNSTADDPIRLALYTDVVKPYLADDEPTAPLTMSFVRYKQGELPPPETFAGIDPYGREQTPLPPDLRKSIIFSMDRGLGGNLKKYSVNRILTFKIAPDTQTGRAVFVGANEIKNFLISDEMCTAGGTIARDGSKSTSYKISLDLMLYIYGSNGQETVRVQGFRSKQPGVIAEFPADGNTLLLKRGQANGFQLSHPGIADDIFVSCARDDFLR